MRSAAAPPPVDPRRAPPLAVFTLLEAPLGIQSAFYVVLIFVVLRTHGATIEQSTALASLCSLPTLFAFLCGPITDFLLPRRVWLVLAASASGLLAAAAALRADAQHLGTLEILMVAGTIANMLVGAAAGGLASSVLRGQARAGVGSWMQIGALGVGSLGFSLFVSLASHADLRVLSWIACGTTILPALAALAIQEPAPKQPTPRHAGRLREMGEEVARTFLDRRNRSGLLLLLSPIGTGTVGNVLTGLSAQYHASEAQLSFSNGWGAGIATAIGALAFLLVPRRLDRRPVFAASALVYGGASLILACGPLSPTTFVTGMLSTNLAQGFCWSALTGLMLSLMDETGRAQSSRYALVGALAMLSSIYMTWCDGRLIGLFGPRALGLFDATANLCAAALFFAVRARWTRRAHAADAVAAPTARLG